MVRIERRFIPTCEKWQEWKCDTSIGVGRNKPTILTILTLLAAIGGSALIVEL